MCSFKEGDKVICVDDGGYSSPLNIGEVYHVYQSTRSSVLIMPHDGSDAYYDNDLFELLKSGSDSNSETKAKEINMQMNNAGVNAMQTISITVEGVEMEKVTLTFDEVQVKSLYSESKVMKAKIAELEKKVKQSDEYKEMYSKLNDESKKELEGANILLTALGVQEKDNNENEYYRKVLPVATRIALYIANQKQG